MRPSNRPSNIQSTITQLAEWCNLNDMKPNPLKCNVMHFSFAKLQPEFPVLSIRDSTLPEVECLKILGITLQRDLKWDSNVNSMVSRASRRLYILCRLRKCNLLPSELTNIYVMYIRPVLEYASPIWSSAITIQQSGDIERVQKRACRIILRGYESYNGALEELGIPSLESRRVDLLSSFSRRLLASSRHRDLLPASRNQRTGRNLRNANTLHIPMCRSTRYQQSVIPSIVRQLNSEMK